MKSMETVENGVASCSGRTGEEERRGDSEGSSKLDTLHIRHEVKTNVLSLGHQ